MTPGSGLAVDASGLGVGFGFGFGNCADADTDTSVIAAHATIHRTRRGTMTRFIIRRRSSHAKPPPPPPPHCAARQPTRAAPRSTPAPPGAADLRSDAT